jgi:hypothetical protein
VLLTLAIAAAFPQAGLASGPADPGVATRLIGSPDVDDLVIPGLRNDAPIAAPDLAAAVPTESPVAPPPPPSARPGRARRTALPPALTASVPASGTGGTWAVVIGIDDYPGNDHDLHAAVNDANDVEQAMFMMGAPGDHVLTLRNGEATSAAIRASIGWLAANAGPDAIGVFFYAGHVRKLDHDTEAMVAADGEDVSDVQLADGLSHMAARRAWIAIAACYGGGFTEVLAPGRVLTGAAPADQVAYENTALNRSYMVEYMVHQAMLEGMAAPNVQAAFAYATAAIGRDYPGRQPVEYDASDGTLDLRSSQSPPPPPSPPPTQGGGGTPPTTAPPRQSCWVFCG